MASPRRDPADTPASNPPALHLQLSRPELDYLRTLGTDRTAAIRLLVHQEDTRRRRRKPAPLPPPHPIPTPTDRAPVSVRLTADDLSALERLIAHMLTHEGIDLSRAAVVRRLIHDHRRAHTH